RLIGNLVAVLTVMKGLPMTYNKDMQEDKQALFDSLDTLELTLDVAAGAVATLKVNPHRMLSALDPAMLATDVAEYLVRKGVPFRDAHHLAGHAVALSERKGTRLDLLTLEDWRSVSEHFGADIAKVFDYARSVASRDVVGGTAPKSVRAQIKAARKLVG
ncbi:MAG: argininosuccinate lyase, partial [Chloroflexi bacterium]|nr:argininosuccinate lyase [Chloroflexota bacterium]